MLRVTFDVLLIGVNFREGKLGLRIRLGMIVGDASFRLLNECKFLFKHYGNGIELSICLSLYC